MDGKAKSFFLLLYVNAMPCILILCQLVSTFTFQGKFDRYTGEYTSINYDNIRHALDVVEAVVLTHKNHPAVLGLEPLNEPWEKTPIDHLKRFYWNSYLIVKEHAPLWKYVIHDSFRLDTNIWGGFMEGKYILMAVATEVFIPLSFLLVKSSE